MTTATQPFVNPSRVRQISFWAVTALLTFELVHGALWDINWLNKGYVYGILKHLGYPAYLATMLGIAKIAAAAVILSPGLQRLKEWAYAGVTILFLGGFVSHLIVGDGVGQFIWSLLFGLLSLLSWWLQYPSTTNLKSSL